jgi:RND family efflux transporter MFP subunit
MRRAGASILLLAALLAGCKPTEEKSAEPAPRTVRSVIAAVPDIKSTGFTGLVQPRYEAALGFQTAGRIVSRDVELGELVSKGDLLATIDGEQVMLAARSAQSQVVVAAAQLANAQASEQRLRTLLAEKSISQADYDSASLAVATAQAQARQADAELDKANDRVTYLELRAETDGVVTAVDSDVGQVVSAGTAVITVARTDVREAVVDIPNEIMAGMSPDAEFDIVLAVDPRTRTSGRIREIAPQADAATRTRRVKILLDDPPAAFRLGSLIYAYPKEAPFSRIVLPASAILEKDGKASVWVVDEAAGTVSEKPVETGKTLAGYGIEINSGLTAGERVVTAGVHELENGQHVATEGGIEE